MPLHPCISFRARPIGRFVPMAATSSNILLISTHKEVANWDPPFVVVEISWHLSLKGMIDRTAYNIIASLPYRPLRAHRSHILEYHGDINS